MTSKMRWVLVAVVAVLLVGLVWWRIADDSSSTAKTPDTASTAPTSDPTTPTGSSSAPSSEPGTAATSTAPSIDTPKTVGLRQSAPIDRGADAQIVSIESVTSKAKGPGEVGGSAIRVTFEVTAGTRAVPVSDISVNAYYGADLTPSIPMTEPGGDPFAGTIAAGKTARGVYVFNVPKNQRADVTVEMFYAADRPAVRFRGEI